jgi:hypothetical protein
MQASKSHLYNPPITEDIHVFNRPMTEGYGDIACQTVLGKLVLACFLSVGLVSSPTFPPGKTGTKKLGFLATF